MFIGFYDTRYFIKSRTITPKGLSTPEVLVLMSLSRTKSQGNRCYAFSIQLPVNEDKIKMAINFSYFRLTS